jgi:hypothetical protein
MVRDGASLSGTAMGEGRMPFFVRPEGDELVLKDSAVWIEGKVWPVEDADLAALITAGWREVVVEFEWPACAETRSILRPKLSPGALRPAPLGSWAPWTIRPMTDGDVQLVSEWKLEVAAPLRRSRQ